MTVAASAPGKIVLSGEYAVLWDAPAVCMAVNRRAVATVSPSDDGECHIVTPGFEGMERYRILDALLGGDRPATTFRLLFALSRVRAAMPAFRAASLVSLAGRGPSASAARSQSSASASAVPSPSCSIRPRASSAVTVTGRLSQVTTGPWAIW